MNGVSWRCVTVQGNARFYSEIKQNEIAVYVLAGPIKVGHSGAGHLNARFFNLIFAKVNSMKTATVLLNSVSPYSQSRHYVVDKLPKEIAKDYEARTWRERMHVNEHGFVYIPAMSFKSCLEEAAKFIGRQIPGKGKSTYTKHFEAGVLVLEHLVLPIKPADVHGEWLFVPSDGIRGSGKRVDKCFPLIPEWKGEVSFTIFDETITEDVFTETLTEAGKFIGIGRWRPRNRGMYGRFEVKSVKWK